MSIEEVGFFVRYLPSIAIALVAVVALSLLTRLLPNVIALPALAEPLELFAYSVRRSGPMIFAAVFLASFFFLDGRQGRPWLSRPMNMWLVVLLLALVLHFVFLPRR